MKINLLNNMKKNYLAVISTILLALVIVAMALADPGGLFAVVSWTGSDPTAAYWWWAPYVVFTPLLLLLHVSAVRSVVGSAIMDRGRIGLFFRIWLIVILSTGVAWFINSVLVLYVSMAGSEYVLTVSSTLSFLLWSSGYATLKLACLGWLPALPAMMLERDPPTVQFDTGKGKNIAALTAGLTLFLVMILSPWLANHWWSGSPVGAVYQECLGLVAPTSVSGIFSSGVTLLICGSIVWIVVRSSLMHMSSVPKQSAVFIAGATAGAVASLALFIVQVLALIANGIVTSDSHDYWFIPAVTLLAVEVCSFALVLAGCSGCAALLGFGLQKKLWPDVATNSTTLKRLGLVVGGIGVAVMAGMALLKSGNGTDNPAAQAMPLDSGAGLKAELQMSPLTVRHDRDHAILANQYGSQVTLRGVNVNQLGEYYQADVNLPGTQVLTQTDFADIASLGLNSVRLTLSWSQLEPERGHISQQYLDRIRQAVAWATGNHVYVVLDIHQDGWSATVAAPKEVQCRAGTEPMKGWDGAPQWATLTDNAPPCEFTGRDLAPNVSRAFQSFYFDRDGIQTELVHVWEILAADFADNSTVIGYDLLNEPNFAETPPITSTLLLANYYARAIAAIRKAEANSPHGYAHPVIIEPSIFWSGFGVDNLPPIGFSHDTQLVYSPHLYNESITSDQDLGINLVSIERGFRLAQHSATRLNAALWIGEWGFFGDSEQQWKLWVRQANAEDGGQISSALWVWKQGCGDPHVYPGKIAGNFVKAYCPDNKPVETDPRVRQIMQRPYTRSAPGRIVQSSFNKGVYIFSGTTDKSLTSASQSNCDLAVWLPGLKQPELIFAQGVANPIWQRIETGSELTGSGGGWILHGCVADNRYQLKIGVIPY